MGKTISKNRQTNVKSNISALLDDGCAPVLAAAFGRELCGGSCEVRFAGMTTHGHEIRFNKTSRQGGKETTYIWNSACRSRPLERK